MQIIEFFQVHHVALCYCLLMVYVIFAALLAIGLRCAKQAPELPPDWHTKMEADRMKVQPQRSCENCEDSQCIGKAIAPKGCPWPDDPTLRHWAEQLREPVRRAE